MVLAGRSLGGAIILAHARAVVDGHLPAVDGVSVDGTLLAAALPVPTLALGGELDKEVTAADAARLMAGLPEAELVTLPAAGHMIVLTHQGDVAGPAARWADLHG